MPGMLSTHDMRLRFSLLATFRQAGTRETLENVPKEQIDSRHTQHMCGFVWWGEGGVSETPGGWKFPLSSAQLRCGPTTPQVKLRQEVMTFGSSEVVLHLVFCSSHALKLLKLLCLIYSKLCEGPCELKQPLHCSFLLLAAA